MKINCTAIECLVGELRRVSMILSSVFAQRISVVLTVLFICVVLAIYGCTAANMQNAASLKSQTNVSNSSSNQAASASNNFTEQGKYKGIAVGITKDGDPVIGSPEAPVTIEEYSDFLCPFCARHYSQTLPDLLEKYVATGKVNYVFRDMPLAALHPTSHIGHAAARCVAEQGAALFWTMHDALFQNQEQWRNLPDPSSYLAEAAKQTGADMSAYTKCLSSGQSEALVQKSVSAGEALSYNGTPTFRFIVNQNGKTYSLSGAYPVDTFHQWIDQLLAGKAPVEDQPEPAPTAKPAELPLWANPKGLTPDPDRPGYTLAGDPYKGSPQALVTVVEFSDFQCPACGKHALDVQPDIDKALVNTGKVFWVFKNLPLKEHPQSPAAATAAECAGEQGKFWQMHDLLFTSIDRWAVDQPDPVIITLAGEQKIDMARFTACFKGRNALEQVLRDVQDSQGVVSTTPSFVILADGQGSILNGSRPADQFITILQKMIDSTSAKKK